MEVLWVRGLSQVEIETEIKIKIETNACKDRGKIVEYFEFK